MPAPLKLKSIICLVVLSFLFIFTNYALGQAREQCLECHEGIEEVSRSHPLKLGCTSCHGGNSESDDKDQAHATLIYDPDAKTGKRNPSSLKVVHLSCGKAQCHSGHEDATRNHADRVRKSMMGTLSGVVTGLRYQWGGQPKKSARYGIYKIEDKDGITPESIGALKHLEELPYFTPYHLKQHQAPQSPRKKISNHVGDHVLRERCFQCHIDAPPPKGEYRSQGCAACHFSYHPEGKYLGRDPMIPKNKPGHPAYHRLTVLPSSNLCLQCHKSFLSQMTTEKFSIPFPQRNPQGKLSFPGSGQPRMDVHLERGMECIDCHTQSDIMGDGNIYSRQFQAVEIRCETCHGDSTSYPRTSKIKEPQDPAIRLSRHYKGLTNKVGDAMAISARQQKIANVKAQGKKFITYSKRTGKARTIPLAKNQRWGHNIPGHQNKLACTACHSQWVPRCEGCHMTLKSGKGNNAAPSSKWNPVQFSVKHEQPALMVGPRGKVVPMLAQPSHTLTVLDQQEKIVPVVDGKGQSPGEYRHWEFTNSAGYSGSNLAYGAQPHSVSKKIRSCASCHQSPKTLGMGEGDLKVKKSATGRYDQFNPLVRTNRVLNKSRYGPEAKVNQRGQAIAGSGQPGARPFNQEEISRILKVGNCIPCHWRYSDKIYQDMEKSYKFSINIKHRRLRDKILKKR